MCGTRTGCRKIMTFLCICRMAKNRTGESKKVANGVGKGKKETKPEGEDVDMNEVEEVAVADEAAASTADAPKRESKKSGKKKAVSSTSRAGTSGRTGERARKAPERFEVVTAPPTKKKKGGRSGAEYAVQAIRGVRKAGSKWEYLVKWEGYSE